jgi:hypothetical protein
MLGGLIKRITMSIEGDAGSSTPPATKQPNAGSTTSSETKQPKSRDAVRTRDQRKLDA